MRWWLSRLSSRSGAKSSREGKSKWLSGLPITILYRDISLIHISQIQRLLKRASVFSMWTQPHCDVTSVAAYRPRWQADSLRCPYSSPVILKADRMTAQTRRPHKIRLCSRRPWVVRSCWGTLDRDHTQCRPPNRIYYFVFLNVFLGFVVFCAVDVRGVCVRLQSPSLPQ